MKYSSPMTFWTLRVLHWLIALILALFTAAALDVAILEHKPHYALASLIFAKCFYEYCTEKGKWIL